MANLQDDIGAAIVETINDLSSAFSALGNTAGVMHAEYESQDVNYNVGATGKCLVVPMPEEPVEGTEYAESCQSVLPYELKFSLVDVRDAGNARTVITQALRTAFRDRGAQLWSNFTDNGTNRLGASGRVTVGQVVEEVTSDPDRPMIVARLEVSVWMKLPAA